MPSTAYVCLSVVALPETFWVTVAFMFDLVSFANQKGQTHTWPARLAAVIYFAITFVTDFSYFNPLFQKITVVK